MFELPEVVILARQLNQTIQGKTIRRGRLGNSPHKFVWYNRSHDEFERLTKGKRIGETKARGRWIFISLDSGYVLLLGELGGKLLYHAPGAVSGLPKRYHLMISFDDDSTLTVMTQMWGAMELYERGQELHRELIKDMRIAPIDPEFTFDYFSQLVDSLKAERKRSTKALLTQDQLIPGLGNSIAQDIMFRAGLHPRHPIDDLDHEQVRALFDATVDTVREAIAKGGRNDERNLFNEAGGYIRIMDRNAPNRPCPRCSGTVTKIQYLGGACYLCPACQS
jgi:formamidopyrimidine-DNA glycosylase